MGKILIIWMYTLFYIPGENWSLEEVGIQNNYYDNISKKLVLLIYECNPKSIFDLWTWIRILVKFCSLNSEFCSLSFSVSISVASVCQFCQCHFFLCGKKNIGLLTRIILLLSYAQDGISVLWKISINNFSSRQRTSWSMWWLALKCPV